MKLETGHPYIFRRLTPKQISLIGFWLGTVMVGLTILLCTIDSASYMGIFLAIVLVFSQVHRIGVAALRCESPRLSAAPLTESEPTSVDILITTLNEPARLLEITINACKQIRGCTNIFVLDDGNRPDIADLAGRLEVNYLTRSTPKNAKAGNLNFGFSCTSAQFVAVFDADAYPFPNFLECTLGYFQNAKVAVVQAHSVVANVDSFQNPNRIDENRYVPNQHEFYQTIQNVCQAFGAPIWSGSGAVLRRSAIAEIGGILEDGETEDYGTSLSLLLNGHQIVYHPVALSLQLGPATFDAFIKQRIRWMRGNYSVLCGRWMTLLTTTVLTKRAKIRYILDAWYYVHMVGVLIMSFIFVLGAALDLKLFQYPIVALAGFLALHRGWTGVFAILDRDKRESAFPIFALLLAVPIASVLFLRLPVLTGFIVTPKEERRGAIHPVALGSYIAIVLLLMGYAFSVICTMVEPSWHKVLWLVVGFGVIKNAIVAARILLRERAYQGGYLFPVANCTLLFNSTPHSVRMLGDREAWIETTDRNLVDITDQASGIITDKKTCVEVHFRVIGRKQKEQHSLLQVAFDWDANMSFGTLYEMSLHNCHATYYQE